MEIKTESAILGGGCFWCLEAAYQLIEGVISVESGFAGGNMDNPSLLDVYSHKTGHAEVVKVTFDTSKIKFANILEIFWAIHDPTTLNRQGYDVGDQYRSVIFYQNDDQRKIAEKSKAEVAKLWPNPIVTEVKLLEAFYKADEDNQNFFNKNPSQAYCQIIINPKLKHLRENFKARLKK